MMLVVINKDVRGGSVVSKASGATQKSRPIRAFLGIELLQNIASRAQLHDLCDLRVNSHSVA